MRVGFLGLGRLGLPIAAVLSQHHQVTGYDPDPSTASRLVVGHEWEEGLTEYLGKIGLAASLDAAIADADVIVVCVQTPHDPWLDGTHDTERREPFDLSYVEKCLQAIGHGRPPVVLMSTLLPGDCRHLSQFVDELIYSPAFPAMGTTVRDVREPEFVLVGHDGFPDGLWLLSDLWNPVVSGRIHATTYETAELAKVAYNTAIGLKIALANTVGWLADETGGDGDKVMEILSQATRRIVSDAYMQPGLGDGGACHPRDQLAMSWLARKHGVYDLFGNLIDQRSEHSGWIADLAREESTARGLDVMILGAAYKRDSTLRDGSPALLMANQTGWHISEKPPETPHIVVIGVNHSDYDYLELPAGSVVIDPWGTVESNVTVIRPGRL